MVKQAMIISHIAIETHLELTLDEICSACRVTPDFIRELVEYGILDLDSDTLETYRFGPIELRRIRTMVHLQHDLEINLPGAALIVDLMDKMEKMQAKIDILEKHYYFK